MENVLIGYMNIIRKVRLSANKLTVERKYKSEMFYERPGVLYVPHVL